MTSHKVLRPQKPFWLTRQSSRNHTADNIFSVHSRFFMCKWAFLHRNSLREAVWSRKIYVKIMRFTCCLNMDFTWKSLNWALICMHDVTLENIAAVTDHFADAFVRENVARVYMTLWRRNVVRKFDTDAILFWEIKCKKGNISCLSHVFSAVYAEIR